MNRKPLTPDQVRQRFRQRGETFTAWSQRHGFDRRAVTRVLTGTDKGDYGRAHEIAVALGLKVPPQESTDLADDRNTQSRVAA